MLGPAGSQEQNLVVPANEQACLIIGKEQEGTLWKQSKTEFLLKTLKARKAVGGTGQGSYVEEIGFRSEILGVVSLQRTSREEAVEALKKSRSGRESETNPKALGGETSRSRRSKTALDLRGCGDRALYVKGPWREKPQVRENGMEVSKAGFARNQPETLAMGEIVMGPKEGSA